MPSIHPAILAGGESRRMGRDKARLEHRGDTLLERTVRLAGGIADRVLVVGRSDPDLASHETVVAVEDRRPDRGPLGGLFTALRQVEAPVLLVACDMPLLDRQVFEWVADPPEVGDVDGIATLRDDRVEPLFSIYFPSILPVVEQRLDDDRLGMRDLVADSHFVHRPLPEHLYTQLTNVNTPEEWEALRNAET